jgi:hypothetical protein
VGIVWIAWEESSAILCWSKKWDRRIGFWTMEVVVVVVSSRGSCSMLSLKVVEARFSSKSYFISLL